MEHLRVILANFNMYVIRPQVSLSIFTNIINGAVVPSEIKQGDLNMLMDQLVSTIARFDN